MRTNLKGLYGFSIVGFEGELGKVEDFYVDDSSWIVKFMVVDAGEWLTSRRVVVSTQSIEDTDCDSSKFFTRLTNKQIESSPEIDTDKHIGQEHETILVRHYRLHPHWPEAGMFGIPPFIPAAPTHPKPTEKDLARAKNRLVVASEVMGCSVEAIDGRLGVLDDFMVDGTWRINELVVKTGELVRRRFWVPVSSVAAVNWDKNTINLSTSLKIVA